MAQQRNPVLHCVRHQHDVQLIPHIQRVWQANIQLYGANKVCKQMHREGITLDRCTVERLMRRLGLQGVRRSQVVGSTTPNKALAYWLDRVNRQCKADRPKQLWVSDLPTCPAGKAGCMWRL